MGAPLLLVALAGVFAAPDPPVVLGEPPPSPLPAPPLPLPQPPPAADAGSRLRLGVRALLGGGETQFTVGPGLDQVPGPESLPGLGLGLYAQIGLQLDDRLGFGAEVGAGTSILWNYARAALTLDYTPTDWLTLAAGPAAWVDAEIPPGCPAFGCSQTTATAAGGTLRLDFNLGVIRTASGRRAYTVGLLTDLGSTLDANSGGIAAPGFAWGLYLTYGYAWY